MHTRSAVAGIAALTLLPAAALAAKPNPGGALSLNTSAATITYPGTVTVSGTLTGSTPLAGVSVTLEQDATRPYGDSYQPSGAKAVTSATGTYAFTMRPAKNTQYRAVAKASPSITSGARLVNVRPSVGIKASTRMPVAGRNVRFSGLVKPARTGATIVVQRRSATGRFVTVKAGTLRAATTGSVYAISVRVRSTGTYRVKLPGTQELVNGFSRTLRITTR